MVRLAHVSHRRCFLERQVLGAFLFLQIEQVSVEVAGACCFLVSLIVLVEVEECLVTLGCCLGCLGFLAGTVGCGSSGVGGVGMSSRFESGLAVKMVSGGRSSSIIV